MDGQHLDTAALSPGNNTYLIEASVCPVRTFGEDNNNKLLRNIINLVPNHREHNFSLLQSPFK